MNSGSSPIGAWLASFTDADPTSIAVIFMGIIVYSILFIPLPLVLLHYADRKLGADIQMRVGPSQTSLRGFFQFMADIIKSGFKQTVVSEGSVLKEVSIVFVLIALFLSLGTIPFSDKVVIANPVSSGLVIILATLFSRLLLFFIAHSSANPWSVIAASRIAVKFSISALPFVISVVPVFIHSKSMNMIQIADAQGGFPWSWHMFSDPGSFLCGACFLTVAHLWFLNGSFDLVSNELELQGGTTIGFTGFTKLLYGISEYFSFYLATCLFVALFLGAGKSPVPLDYFGRASSLVESMIFLFKVSAISLLSIWIKWTIPKLRNDQSTRVGWSICLPLAFGGMILSIIWFTFSNGRSLAEFL